MKPLHELDALCAEKVAGYNTVQPNPLYPDRLAGFECPGSRDMVGIPPYTTDPAAVLGLLEKEWYWVSDNGGLIPGKAGHEYYIRVGRIGHPEGRAKDPSFCVDATLALLKAHGVETE